MYIKFIFLCVFTSVLFLTDASITRFGRIRKRKNFLNTLNNSAVEDDLNMYYTRRTTLCPRLRVTLDPSIEEYYYKKHKKEDFIRRAYFEKAKKEKKKTSNIKATDSSLRTAPALD